MDFDESIKDFSCVKKLTTHSQQNEIFDGHQELKVLEVLRGYKTQSFFVCKHYQKGQLSPQRTFLYYTLSQKTL